MRPAGDVGDEMTNDCFDEAFESYLAGRPVAAHAAALVAFGDDVRAAAAAPGRPSPQLAQMLTRGLLGSSDMAVVGAVPVPRSAEAGGPRRRRRTVFGVLTAAAARLTPAGAVAQASLGLGLVLAGVTGAGAAGVLPGPVQDEVSAVFEAVTPFELPHSSDDRSTADEDSATPVAVVPETGEAQDGEFPADTPAPAEFGQGVSGAAKDDGVAGHEISEQARATHGPEVPATERPVPANPAPDRGETRGPAPSPASPALPGSSADPEPGRP